MLILVFVCVLCACELIIVFNALSYICVCSFLLFICLMNDLVPMGPRPCLSADSYVDLLCKLAVVLIERRPTDLWNESSTLNSFQWF